MYSYYYDYNNNDKFNYYTFGIDSCYQIIIIALLVLPKNHTISSVNKSLMNI